MSELIESHERAYGVSLHKNGPVAGLVGGVGLIALLGGMFFTQDPNPWQAYLFGWIVWMSLSVGCLGLLLLKHTLNAKWGLPVERILEAGASVTSFLVLAITFLPILYTVLSGNPILYPWADPAKVASDHLLHAKAWFLNPIGFAVRFVIYFAIWIFFARKISASTLRQDQNHSDGERAMRANWSAPGLVIYFLVITSAFTEWIMSLEPTWSSTMYGPWLAVGGALMALAFVTIIATLNADRDPYREVVTKNWQRDMGNLMFTFTMLWGYTTFSQYLIIWSGNVPEYITYFVRRSENRWNAIGLAVMIGQFFVPFLALLSPRIKAQAPMLAKVAGWIIVFRIVDMYYVIIPSMRATPVPSLWDFVALIGMGGLWAFAFSKAIANRALLPSYDPRLTEAAHAH